MSYRCRYEGFDNLENTLNRLSDKSTNICKGMVWTGAGLLADTIKKSLVSSVSDESTGELAKSLDISEMVVDGNDVYTKIKFVGYSREGTDTEVPNGIKAAVLESGRSDQDGRNTTHFYSNAVRGVRKAVIYAMQEKLDKMVEAITKAQSNTGD